MPRKKIRKSDRVRVEQRAKGCCEYCMARSDYAYHTFTIDHILALVLSGTDALNNLAYCCRNCNGSKSDKNLFADPISDLMVRCFNPRIDTWTDHFVWSEDFSEIIGITAIGRATVTGLRMNRTRVINLRLVLAAAGFHPPVWTVI